ncbi:DUF2474 family protein [Ectopseudomonas hydrolytica]|uniref:DUF2474 family protein n=1 Tax=Ectopseudomonas hydrolytica TaxID=2493633 RepID=UPI003EE278E7
MSIRRDKTAQTKKLKTRLLWLASLWLAGVFTVAILAELIRFAMRAAGLGTP